MIAINGMKQCSACEKVKPVDEFHRCKSSPDGRYSICIVCKKARWHSANGRTYSGGCGDTCKFLKDCRREIWRPTFSPYCFKESRYHGQFVKAYGKQLEAQA